MVRQDSKETAVRWVLAFRAAYFLSLVLLALLQHWGTLAVHVPVFFGSLIVPWLGRKDHRYYPLDTYIVCVFLLSIIAGFAGLISTDSGLLGFDKVLHAAGGFGLAWFALLAFGKRLEDRRARYVSMILAGIVLGLAWEAFEVMLFLLPEPFSVWHAGTADTLLDLVADGIGSAIAISVLARAPRRA